MINVKCIKKIYDTKHNITGYVLQSEDQRIVTINSSNVKAAIFTEQLNVTNLTLTSDGRLVDRKRCDDTIFDDYLQRKSLLIKELYHDYGDRVQNNKVINKIEAYAQTKSNFSNFEELLELKNELNSDEFNVTMQLNTSGRYKEQLNDMDLQFAIICNCSASITYINIRSSVYYYTIREVITSDDDNTYNISNIFNGKLHKKLSIEHLSELLLNLKKELLSGRYSYSGGRFEAKINYRVEFVKNNYTHTKTSFEYKIDNDLKVCLQTISDAEFGNLTKLANLINLDERYKIIINLGNVHSTADYIIATNKQDSLRDILSEIKITIKNNSNNENMQLCIGIFDEYFHIKSVHASSPELANRMFDTVKTLTREHLKYTQLESKIKKLIDILLNEQD